MKKLTMGLWLVLGLSIITIAACGNDSGQSGQHQFTNAVVKLSTSTTSTIIGGVDATIVLPAGVIVSSTFPPKTDNGVIVPASQVSSDALTTGVFTPAGGASPATVNVFLVSTTGFSSGEYVSVKCKISTGSYPTQSDFSLSSSPSPTVYDINGAVVSGATVSLSVSFL